LLTREFLLEEAQQQEEEEEEEQQQQQQKIYRRLYETLRYTHPRTESRI